MVQPEDRTFRVLQSDLVNEMRETIRARGPQPFSWFMREALYHPLHGYYSSGRAIIGRRGDYFTNVSVGPMFGRLLAAQFAEMWRRLGQPHDFTIVEQGAHDGQFARDVLDALRTDAPELFETVRYRIVEPFPALQDRQRNGLHDFAGKVEWCDVLAPFTGVHFSNELLDAIPVDLWSRLVGLDQDRFIFAEGPVNSRPNESQLAWVDDAAANLQQGFVLAIDYGFARPDFREVVQARAQHRHLDSVFEMIGDADISVHINWTDMAERALNRGLHLAGFTDQHHFLTGILAHLDIIPRSLDLTALSSQVSEQLAADALDAADKRALQTLLHPEMLGRAFQVLCLAKSVELDQPLGGFRFAREARKALAFND